MAAVNDVHADDPQDRRPAHDLEQPETHVGTDGSFDVTPWAQDVGELLALEALTDEIAAIDRRAAGGAE